MTAFQAQLKRFEKYHAQVLGISSDTLKTHERFAAEYGIEFPLVADPGGRIQKKYEGGRITYLVDRNGTIRLIQRGFPEIDELLEAVRALGAP